MAMAAKARVYLGAPRNYGPTEEELASKAAEEAATKQAQADEEAAEKKRREAHDARRMAELQQQEPEVRAIPLRNYLMQNVIPTLTEGLIEVCKLKPEDPVDYLAEWLFKNNPVEEDHFES